MSFKVKSADLLDRNEILKNLQDYLINIQIIHGKRNRITFKIDNIEYFMPHVEQYIYF